VTIHTNINGRNSGLLALVNTYVTILTIDLIDTCMHFVGIIDRLLGLIIGAATQVHGTFSSVITPYQEKYDGEECDVALIAEEGNRFLRSDALLLIGHLFQIGIHL